MRCRSHKEDKNGNNIYSTTINPNGAKDIIYIKNPNLVEEKILDIY